MKTKSLITALTLLALTTAQAAAINLNYRVDKLTLKNREVLTGATFKSYDTLSGKVVVQTPGQLRGIPLNMLPDEVAAQILQQAPKLTEAEIQAEQQRLQDAQQQASRRAAEWEKSALAESKADRTAQREINVKAAENKLMKQAGIETKVAEAAQEMARHYFKYEADPSSNRGYIFNSNILLSDPEPVQGWTNRWRVRGKVGIQYLTTNLGAVGRSSKDFEMLIDAPEKGQPELVDVTVK